MSNPYSPVTEDELHAYVDGELPADRRETVEAWLATHPEDAARVAAWRAQADAMRARYGALAQAPVPERLKLDRLTRSQRSRAGLAAAAALLAFALGGGVGWMARGASAAAPSMTEIFSAEALGAHRLYIGEVRHPIEVGATEKHLIPWLSRRVGTSLRAPDLGAHGLKLLGGRLLPGPRGPAALFMYEGATGERFTIYCSRAATPQTAFRYSVTDKFATFHWVENSIGYALSGPADRDRLMNIAKTAYDQMESGTPDPNSSTSIQLMSRRGS